MYKDEGGVVHSDGSLRVDDSGGMDIEVASAGYLSIRKPFHGGFQMPAGMERHVQTRRNHRTMPSTTGWKGGFWSLVSYTVQLHQHQARSIPPSAPWTTLLGVFVA